ncbi:MAG: pyridoxamine kinase [Oscillospiraceae bacterium]|nr:pyridoxamine kinase [Oscillospiraceae bacterium]
MTDRLKRVAAIHDISGFGKCSLTVALPIISAAGVETSVIPTAVLSTHTGGFENYTYRDLTDDILPWAAHWKSIDFDIDAFYTGFLGSYQQIEIVSKVFDMLANNDTVRIVDPVMGDNGKLYSVFDDSFPVQMKMLCSKADVIVPNITEAFLLLGEPFKEGPYSEELIENMLVRLSELGPEKIVLTGAYFDESYIACICYDKKAGSTDYIYTKRIEGFFHGTGDVFASVLTACIVKGLRLTDAVKTAADFTEQCIIRTKNAGTDVRFGVDFETGLSGLRQMIEDNNEG